MLKLAEKEHGFRYDVDLILGGKMLGLERCDFFSTTLENDESAGGSERALRRRDSTLTAIIASEKDDTSRLKARKGKKTNACRIRKKIVNVNGPKSKRNSKQGSLPFNDPHAKDTSNKGLGSSCSSAKGPNCGPKLKEKINKDKSASSSIKEANTSTRISHGFTSASSIKSMNIKQFFSAKTAHAHTPITVVKLRKELSDIKENQRNPAIATRRKKINKTICETSENDIFPVEIPNSEDTLNESSSVSYCVRRSSRTLVNTKQISTSSPNNGRECDTVKKSVVKMEIPKKSGKELKKSLDSKNSLGRVKSSILKAIFTLELDRSRNKDNKKVKKKKTEIKVIVRINGQDFEKDAFHDNQIFLNKTLKQNSSPCKARKVSRTRVKSERDPITTSNSCSKHIKVEEHPILGEKLVVASGMFDRHKKELEKSLARLEHLDRNFGYFLGEPPEAFEEHYNIGSDQDCNNTKISEMINKSELNNSSISEPISNFIHNQSTDNHGKREHVSKQEIIASTKMPPAYNFTIIEKRMRNGRYILDRAKLKKEEQVTLMSPYVEWKKRKNSILNNIERHTEIDEQIKQLSSDSNIESKYITEPVIVHPNGMHWDLFHEDVTKMCDAAITRHPEADTVIRVAKKIKLYMDQIYRKTGKRHMIEMAHADAYHKFSRILLHSVNNEAAFQQEWRKHAFPERKYQRLAKSSVICDGLSPLDQRSALHELETSLPNSFIGLSYTYNDVDQSEAWMTTVKNISHNTKRRKKDDPEEEFRVAEALAADHGVVRAQVETTMEVMLLRVQDSVMTDFKILDRPEKRSANWLDGDDRKVKTFTPISIGHIQKEVHIPNASEIETERNTVKSLDPDVAEQPVWGPDCYTRKNISLVLEEDFDTEIAVEFIDKWLLPAINSCPEAVAHELSCACRILEGLQPIDDDYEIELRKSSTEAKGSHVFLSRVLADKISIAGPPWLKACAHQLRMASEALGESAFRIHPKGHGCVVLCRDGVTANSLVTHYRGEVYPAWRWGEKLDAIEQAQQRFGLRPNLPDFYNMALERPQQDPKGYGLLFIDASRKAGWGSSFSHSCEPTCEVKVVAVNGKLSLAMTTLRNIESGEELTFDYNAVTESVNEYHAAVCLCGHTKCRGSFLHFATADCYQEVLKRNSTIAVRFSNLLKGCMKKVMSTEDEEVLDNHGFGTATFGAVSFNYYNGNVSNTAHANSVAALDSMENVPIWLRTYTAETLRYIEYERRALPIALLCNHKSGSTGCSKDGNDYGYKRRKKNTDKEKISQGKKCVKKKISQQSNANHDSSNRKISFKAADAEGWAAMEQRIHNLVQSLSRVGRVLDRHRESAKQSLLLSEQSLTQLHSPLSIMPDEKVISNLWCDPSGLRLRLLHLVSKEYWIIPSLSKKLNEISNKFHLLDDISSCEDISSSNARLMLSAAFLEFRLCILKSLAIMNEDAKQYKKTSKYKIRGKKEVTKPFQNINENIDEDEVDDDELLTRSDVYKESIKDSSNQMSPRVDCNDMTCIKNRLNVNITGGEGINHNIAQLKPWVKNRKQRYKLEASADLLLLYAHTTLFFEFQSYCPFESTPIAVHAHELGNDVPRSVIEKYDVENNCQSHSTHDNQVEDYICLEKKNEKVKALEQKNSVKRKKSNLCESDDVVANVTVKYSGEYVLSLLLQWYSGGIGLKQGLPDMLGCIKLPDIDGCWIEKQGVKEIKRETEYKVESRPLLVEWFEDRYKRGDPWPEQVSKFFTSQPNELRSKSTGMGSPVLDYLIGGDNSNLEYIINALKEGSTTTGIHEGRTRKSRSTVEKLKSSLDDGMPAQAVANWVQCDDPKCLKWRKIPWHADVDLLPDKFFCKDNKWSTEPISCDAPEDVWDDNDAPVLRETKNKISEVDFRKGGKHLQRYINAIILNSLYGQI